MPHDEIQLNRIILPKERRLTRRGIVYYSWVKSSRRNCFYLLPLKKCEKYVRLAGGAAFISAVLFLTFRMFYEPGKWRDFLIAGGVLNGLTLLLTFSYCRNAVRTLRLLPRLPIAVADLDRGVLKALPPDAGTPLAGRNFHSAILQNRFRIHDPQRQGEDLELLRIFAHLERALRRLRKNRRSEPQTASLRRFEDSGKHLSVFHAHAFPATNPECRLFPVRQVESSKLCFPSVPQKKLNY